LGPIKTDLELAKQEARDKDAPREGDLPVIKKKALRKCRKVGVVFNQRQHLDNNSTARKSKTLVTSSYKRQAPGKIAWTGEEMKGGWGRGKKRGETGRGQNSSWESGAPQNCRLGRVRGRTRKQGCSRSLPLRARDSQKKKGRCTGTRGKRWRGRARKDEQETKGMHLAEKVPQASAPRKKRDKRKLKVQVRSRYCTDCPAGGSVEECSYSELVEGRGERDLKKNMGEELQSTSLS